MPHSQRAEKQYHPFIYPDRHLGAGWSSVYTSSKSHVVVKSATVRKKDKAELRRQTHVGKIAYHKLSRITGWVVSCLYGEHRYEHSLHCHTTPLMIIFGRRQRATSV